MRKIVPEARTLKISQIFLDNEAAISNFTSEDLLQIALWREQITTDTEAMKHLVSFYERKGFNFEILDHYAVLRAELKSKYNFADDNLAEFLKERVNEYHERLTHITFGRTQTTPYIPPDLGCSVYCASAAESSYRNKIEDAGADMERMILKAEQSAYFAGCMQCCNNNCGPN